MRRRSFIASLPLAAAGKLKALAVTSAKRSALAPELPTVAESGLAGFEVSGWYGLAAAAATPAAAVARLNAETNRALKSAAMIAEVGLVVAFFSLPPMVVALSGGAITRRFGRGSARAA